MSQRSLKEVREETLALADLLCLELANMKELTPMHYWREYKFIDLLHEWRELTTLKH